MSTNQVCFPSGCEVVGHISLSQEGSFVNDIFYIKGTHQLAEHKTSFVNGYTGPETKVIVYGIVPIKTFHVVEKLEGGK